MELLKVEEMAERLQVNSRTIYNYIKHNQLKAVKMGRRLYVNKESFEDLLKKGTEKNYLSI